MQFVSKNEFGFTNQSFEDIKKKYDEQIKILQRNQTMSERELAGIRNKTNSLDAVQQQQHRIQNCISNLDEKLKTLGASMPALIEEEVS